MGTLFFRIFGKVQMQSSEATISSFPTRHAEELLLYLLLHPDIPHTREFLVDLLWPDIPLKKGRARLSTVLWQLRTLFDQMSCSIEDFMKVRRKTITLDTAIPIKSDSIEFTRCLQQARQRRDDDIEARKAMLKTACEQYRGELGTGIYGEWCLIFREKFARQYLQAQAGLMAIYMKQEAWQLAVEVGQSILADDPLREDIHRALMECYFKMDHYSLAIAQYQTLSELLDEAMFIQPMPETIKLFVRVVNGRYQQKQLSSSHKHALECAYQKFHRASLHLTTLLNQQI